MGKPKRRTEPILAATDLRIVGGKFRGRKLRYEPFRTGDEPVTRPMKHRVRESIFNLVGLAADGRHAIDLFAGTGALGLEALSRGAAHATFIEKHVPTARVIEENIKALGVEGEATLLMTSAFLWGKRDAAGADERLRTSGFGLHESDKRAGSSPTPASASSPTPASASSPTPAPPLPWLVFCSPPYSFYIDRQGEMLDLLRSVMDAAPVQSILVVEADEHFDFGLLPTSATGSETDEAWDVRTYAPAVVGVWRKG